MLSHVLLLQVQPVIRDMAKWAIGFAAISAIYLTLGIWVIRRRRAAKQNPPNELPSPSPTPASKEPDPDANQG